MSNFLLITIAILLFYQNIVLASYSLPNLKVHPLPESLAAYKVDETLGDYFAAVKENTPEKQGYLIWSQLPVTVYLDIQSHDDEIWVKAVETAISQWNSYLPLTIVTTPEKADIIIEASSPPVAIQRNPDTGNLQITRARAGITRYEFYLKGDNPGIFSHRMQIQVKPGRSYQAILATSLHELGHALGIWGHSSVETDILYYAQNSLSVSISARDINTLKKIYQQPTRLGWVISQ